MIKNFLQLAILLNQPFFAIIMPSDLVIFPQFVYLLYEYTGFMSIGFTLLLLPLSCIVFLFYFVLFCIFVLFKVSKTAGNILAFLCSKHLNSSFKSIGKEVGLELNRMVYTQVSETIEKQRQLLPPFIIAYLNIC